MWTQLSTDFLSPVMFVFPHPGIKEETGNIITKGNVHPAMRQKEGRDLLPLLLHNRLQLKTILLQKQHILMWHILIPFPIKTDFCLGISRLFSKIIFFPISSLLKACVWKYHGTAVQSSALAKISSHLLPFLRLLPSLSLTHLKFGL